MTSNEFILNWLNKELKFQPNIKDISKEFSNGYRFAEVLYKLNEISKKELEEFYNTDNYDLIKINFYKLKNLFISKLNLNIRKEEFKEVYNHDISIGTLILYKIKN